MAYAFGGQGGMPKVSIWVVDEANTESSRQIIADLRKSSMLQFLPKEDAPAITVEKLRSKVADGDAHHGLIIPAGFGTTAEGDQILDLKMIRDPGREMEDRIIQFGLMQTLMTNSDGALWQRSLRKMFREQGMQPEQLAMLESAIDAASNTIRDFLEQDDSTVEATTPSAPVASGSMENSGESESRPDVEENQSADPMQFMANMLPIENEDITPPKRPKMVTYQQAQSVSGMSVMMLMFGLTSAGALLLAEREQGTLRRLLALPIRRESILLGKFFFVFVVGLSQMLVLLVYGEWMFHVGLWRDPITTIGLAVVWVAAAGSFGLFIATFSSSAKQADGLSTIIVLAMAALGGCWFPVQQMNLPLPLAIASKSNHDLLGHGRLSRTTLE